MNAGVMDRRIEKKRWSWKRITLTTAVVLVVAWTMHNIIYSNRERRLYVSAERLTIAQVRRSVFQEWISVNGTVIPAKEVCIDTVGDSGESVRSHLESTKRKLENSILCAPVDSRLISLGSEPGQTRPAGVSIARMDELDGFKVRCTMKENYINRVAVGQTAKCTHAGAEYELVITGIRPEVKGGGFDVEMEFTSTESDKIKQGQNLRIVLEFGSPAEALLLRRGGFYQSTGGHWVFVLDRTGSFAVRRGIKIGRQNADVLEVLEGLEPGEMIITSSYDNFGNAEKIVLKNRFKCIFKFNALIPLDIDN